MRFKIALIVGAAAAFSAPAVASGANSDVPEITALAARMGQLVFYRPSSMGGIVSCRVSEGDKVVNSLHPGKYFVLQTTPGVHEYSVQSESKDVLRVNVEEGETEFARCNINMGILVGRPNLSTQDRSDFERRGKKLKLEPALDAKADEKADAKS
jgi:hypothetical protein